MCSKIQLATANRCYKSVKEMDVLCDSSCETDENQVWETSRCESIKFKNSSHPVRLFEALQYMRNDDILCDIKLETDDDTMVIAHKVVLVSASPYFAAMFCNMFQERNKYLVKISEFDSTALKLLIDYIYTGEIIITNENVQVLVPAANILQLDYIIEACTDYLLLQMEEFNCLAINAFANVHNCMRLMTCSEEYIKNHFLDVVESDDFLSLSSQQVINLISCNDIAVPHEEKVFECVIKWVKFNLECRTDVLPELMEHVRLSLLLPTTDILLKIFDEPLLKNSPNCRKYLNEVLEFNLLMAIQSYTLPQTIRCKPRQSGGLLKVILTFNCPCDSSKCYTEWYDPVTKLRKTGPKMNDCHRASGLAIIRDQFVFAVGGVNVPNSQCVKILDLYSRSPCFSPMVDMIVKRNRLAVGIIDDCLYAVGGHNGTECLNSAEVFNVSTQKWQMISSMHMNRVAFGVGVINNRLYAVGGHDGTNTNQSVECYDPTLDTWTFIENMSVPRFGVGVGVINGILYAVGGVKLKSVEAFNPKTGVWSAVANMHKCRTSPGVVALDGLLYVIGGIETRSTYKWLNSMEIYNPSTNTWVMEVFQTNTTYCFSGVVVDRPFHLTRD